MNEGIWFFLAEVRARKGEQQALREGSSAHLQCFLAAASIEDALHKLDGFLAAEAFDRIAVLRAQFFERDYTRSEISNDAVFEGLEHVASTGLPFRGIMVVDRETAAWKS
jgi:hypothetical protein